MTKRTALLHLDSLQWAFQRSHDLQDKYLQDFVQQTPEFVELLDSTMKMLAGEIEKLLPN